MCAVSAAASTLVCYMQRGWGTRRMHVPNKICDPGRCPLIRLIMWANTSQCSCHASLMSQVVSAYLSILSSASAIPTSPCHTYVCCHFGAGGTAPMHADRPRQPGIHHNAVRSTIDPILPLSCRALGYGTCMLSRSLYAFTFDPRAVT